MYLENDQSCSWVNDLNKRYNIKILEKNKITPISEK